MAEYRINESELEHIPTCLRTIDGTKRDREALPPDQATADIQRRRTACYRLVNDVKERQFQTRPLPDGRECPENTRLRNA